MNLIDKNISAKFYRTTDKKSLRFERKYKVENLAKAVALQMVKNHPASFKKIFPDRWINNIYFDNPDLKAYKDNVIGAPRRAKFRVRWYGKSLSQIDNPILEIKAKENELGTKKLIPIDSFSLQHLTNPPVTTNSLAGVSQKINQILPEQIALQPVLLNSYLRSYFGTTDGRFRITIDTHLNYHSLLLYPDFKGYRVEEEAVIIELKYDGEHSQWADGITQFIPFRQTKSSKYVSGVELTT